MDGPKGKSDEKFPSLTTREELDKELKKAAPKLVVVMFHATWCAPSIMMGQVLDNVSNDNKDCVFIKVNTDKAEALADELDIDKIPSFFFYRDLNKIDELLGANEYMFKEKLAKNNTEQ